MMSLTSQINSFHMNTSKNKKNFNYNLQSQQKSINHLHNYCKSLVVKSRKLHYVIQIIQWRNKTSFPIVKVSQVYKWVGSEQFGYYEKFKLFQPYIQLNSTCQTCQQIKFIIIIESICAKFIDLPMLELPVIMYTLKQMLVGFRFLFQKLGSFHINDGMVVINNKNQLKVWVNENLISCQCNNGQYITQKQLLRQIISLCSSKCISTKLSNDFFNKLQEQYLKTEDNFNFIKVMQIVNCFVNSRKIMIPHQISYQTRKKKTNQGKYWESRQKNETNLSLEEKPRGFNSKLKLNNTNKHKLYSNAINRNLGDEKRRISDKILINYDIEQKLANNVSEKGLKEGKVSEKEVNFKKKRAYSTLVYKQPSKKQQLKVYESKFQVNEQQIKLFEDVNKKNTIKNLQNSYHNLKGISLSNSQDETNFSKGSSYLNAKNILNSYKSKKSIQNNNQNNELKKHQIPQITSSLYNILNDTQNESQIQKNSNIIYDLKKSINNLSFLQSVKQENKWTKKISDLFSDYSIKQVKKSVKFGNDQYYIKPHLEDIKLQKLDCLGRTVYGSIIEDLTNPNQLSNTILDSVIKDDTYENFTNDEINYNKSYQRKFHCINYEKSSTSNALDYRRMQQKPFKFFAVQK